MADTYLTWNTFLENKIENVNMDSVKCFFPVKAEIKI